MRRSTGLALAVGMAIGAAAGPAATAVQDRAADAQAIRAHIESIFDAFIEKDRDKLAATHGRNWRGYLTGARTVIKGRDGYMRAAVGDGPMGPKGQGMVGYKIREYDTVIIYTSYELDVAEGSRTRTEKGKATEVFVFRDGRWLNTGWQLAPETTAP